MMRHHSTPVSGYPHHHHHRPNHPHPHHNHHHHGHAAHHHHHQTGQDGAGYGMYAEARRYLVMRYIISGVVSILISVPLVVIGALLIVDIWQLGATYMGIILVSTGAIGLLGGLIGLIMALSGACGPKSVTPTTATMPMQIQPYPYSPTPGGWAQPGAYPAATELAKPPGYSPPRGASSSSPSAGPASSGGGQVVYVQPSTSDRDRQSGPSIQSPPPRYTSPSPARPASLQH